ncbi:MAG: hypothetical protein A3H93_01495 [Rhodocyclales bacterium RIFCSPLOWO2_02_FULL_63_24]|nr:MAG: hypothetical protein A2040_17155 [Rhodocyclales bacterium GWA2_65_19]OHC70086.1 MAG: hypothetical protein A3H93_01495 [Rhodocyclales bacterium RIFCSPLOWO2_02_FULL_63_24]
MKDRQVFLRHLADCLRRVREYTAEGRDQFMRDHKTQDAVIRNLEIVGQIVRDLGPENLAAQNPEVPWARIAGARNVLAHQYLGVDLALVWNIVEHELDAFEVAIEQLIEA